MSQSHDVVALTLLSKIVPDDLSAGCDPSPIVSFTIEVPQAECNGDK